MTHPILIPRLWLIFICLTFIAPIPTRAADEPSDADLKSPKYWLDKAAAQGWVVKQKEFDDVSIAVEFATAQCNSGDSAGAIATAGRILDEAGRASTLQLGAYDRIAAAAIL